MRKQTTIVVIGSLRVNKSEKKMTILIKLLWVGCHFFFFFKFNSITFMMMIFYPIYTKYLDRQAWANSVDSDQMPQDVISNQGLQF